MSILGNKTEYQNAPYFSGVGNGTNTAFTLSWKPGYSTALIVIVGGIPQDAANYTVSENVLTFSTAPVNGAKILVFGRGLLGVVNQPADGSISSSKLDPTGITLPAGSYGVPCVEGMFKRLKLSTTGTSAPVTVTCDEIVLGNGTGSYFTARGVSLTDIIGTRTGANGIDTGTFNPNSWYSVWVIYNPLTQTVAGLLSSSETTPVLPIGYQFKARVGWIRTDGTNNKFPLAIVQHGNKVWYKLGIGTNVTSYPAIAAGVQGNTTIPTWASAALSAFIPTTAPIYSVSALVTTQPQSFVMVASNTTHGGYTSLVNPAPIVLGPYATAGYTQSVIGNLLNEDGNIYFASLATGMRTCITGWEDKL